MIQLLSADLLQEPFYREVGAELEGICSLSHSPKEAQGLASSHYMLDYPWIVSQVFSLTPPGPSPIYCDIGQPYILEAGSGRGVLQLCWARFALDGFNVHTVDRRPEIASWAVEQEKRFTIRLNFSAQDLKELSFDDNFFDVIVSASSLEHNSLEDAPKILRELVRVLKPGGYLIATLIAKKETEVFHAPPKDPVFVAYSEKDLRRVWCSHPSLSLLNESCNYDRYDEIAKQFFATFRQGYIQTRQYIPVGIVLRKKGTSAK